MPNWCMNTVEITGELPKLEAIKAAAESGNFLEYLVPIGEWDYEKAVETWGVKWDIHEGDMQCHLDPDTGILSLSFNSAWGPPTEAYSKGEADHNIRITAYYYESGMMFAGKYEDGLDSSYDIDFDKDDWAADIPEDIVSELMLDMEYESWKEYEEEEDMVL